MEITVSDMVFALRTRIDADGLYNVTDGCGCPIEDLSPDNCMCEFCMAASLEPMDHDDAQEYGMSEGSLWFVPFKPKAVV